ncbi:MAG TPA: PQQ-binding-like beta-propeller repeat protein, partial [Thermoanaerobaculia bacterium]
MSRNEEVSMALRRCSLFLTVLLSGCVQDATQQPRKTQPPPIADDGWPTYNRTLDGQRYSPLKEITAANVARLQPVCEFVMGEEGGFQTGPVIIGNTMFLTTAHTTVAMNATTCSPIWRNLDTARKDDPFPINRGVAYLDGRVYRGSPGGRLVALNASTGKMVWEQRIANGSVGEFLSSAPIAWNGMVFIGLAGGDWGIRGAMMGFDAATGRQLWKFYTIPVGNERGAETWKIPETAHRGGGAMWTSYTLDPATGELFVPVGNPAPDLNPGVRPGDNLFTNSVVVLDARTGALKWWYQTVANDGFDWDMSAAPALYTTSSGEHRVAIAGKEGMLAGVDRTTHAPAFKIPITTILNADKDPTPEGIRACPGVLGGVEWNGPAFDPTSQTLYVGSVDWCATFTSGAPEYIAGQLYMGTGFKPDPLERATGWLHAVNGNDGSVRWKKQMTHRGHSDGRRHRLHRRHRRQLFRLRCGERQGAVPVPQRRQHCRRCRDLFGPRAAIRRLHLGQRVPRNVRHEGQPEGRRDGARRARDGSLHRRAPRGERPGTRFEAAAPGARGDGVRRLLRRLSRGKGGAGGHGVEEADRRRAGCIRQEPDRDDAEAVSNSAGRCRSPCSGYVHPGGV